MDKGRLKLGSQVLISILGEAFFLKNIIRSLILLPGRQDMFYTPPQHRDAALHHCDPFLRSLSHLESCALLENSCFVQNQFAYFAWVFWGFQCIFVRHPTSQELSYTLLPLPNACLLHFLLWDSITSSYKNTFCQMSDAKYKTEENLGGRTLG